MYNQASKSAHFQALHVPGQPLVLFNIWDPGSALAVAASGAKALATGSWSVAKAFGYEDGEKLPMALAIANLQRITQVCELPVSIDLESGYSSDAEGIGESIQAAINAGGVGCNLEDSDPASTKMRGIPDQVTRISDARAGAAGAPFFINARSDVFFQTPSVPHTLCNVGTSDRARGSLCDGGRERHIFTRPYGFTAYCNCGKALAIACEHNVRKQQCDYSSAACGCRRGPH